MGYEIGNRILSGITGSLQKADAGRLFLLQNRLYEKDPVAVIIIAPAEFCPE